MRRILCVDDHVDSCELMKFILTDAFPECRIDTVDDPEKALDLISRGSYDLYLLDLWLPGMDGAELCRRDPYSDHGERAGQGVRNVARAKIDHRGQPRAGRNNRESESFRWHP